MTLDLGIILPWITAAMSIIAFAGALKAFFGSGTKENAEKIKKLEEKLTDHDRRIQKVEGELQHLPSKDTVNELKLAIAELKGTVGTLGETVGSVSRTVHRIDDYLRQEGKG